METLPTNRQAAPSTAVSSYWDYLSLEPIYRLTAASSSLVYHTACNVARASYDAIASAGEFAGSLIPSQRIKTIAYHTIRFVEKGVGTFILIEAGIAAFPYLILYLGGRTVAAWTVPETLPYFQFAEKTAFFIVMSPIAGLWLIKEIFFYHAFKEQFPSDRPLTPCRTAEEVSCSLKVLGIYDEVMENRSQEALNRPRELNLSRKQIRKAVRPLWMKHHPDKGGDEEAFKAVQTAKEILELYASD